LATSVNFLHQCGINSAVMNDFIADDIVKNLAVFVSQILCWYFEPNTIFSLRKLKL